MEPRNEWRPLVAVLANPEMRRVAAELMLGESLDAAMAQLPPVRRERVTKALVAGGLVHAETLTFEPDVFRELLDSAAAPKPQGIERFFDDKRIRHYPANLGERGRLLAHVANDAFDDDEVLTEREVNERLLPYSDDVAVLRRYLVDYQLLERRADGTEYALASGARRAAASLQLRGHRRGCPNPLSDPIRRLG